MISELDINDACWQELARMLQTQEEEIFTEEIDRDRKMAIEAQDKELAKLLYEKVRLLF